MMLRHQDVCVKTLFSDWGGEYTSKEFEDYLARKGTKHRLTVQDTPEQNGVAEQLNHTLVEKTRAMLLESNLLDKTPYEMVHGQKPNLHDAYEWEKDVYVKIKQDDKLAHQATKAKWIGHSSQGNGHLIYWPSRNKISVERNIVFNTGEKVKLPPTSPSDESKVPMSKKLTITPPIVPSIPSTPGCDLLSQPSGKGWIEEIIEPGPEQELEDIQLSQRPIIGSSEQAQPRRSKRIHLQQEKNLSSGPVTRSQARRDTREYSSTLAMKLMRIIALKPLEWIQVKKNKSSITITSPSVLVQSQLKKNA